MQALRRADSADGEDEGAAPAMPVLPKRLHRVGGCPEPGGSLRPEAREETPKTGGACTFARRAACATASRDRKPGESDAVPRRSQTTDSGEGEGGAYGEL